MKHQSIEVSSVDAWTKREFFIAKLPFTIREPYLSAFVSTLHIKHEGKISIHIMPCNCETNLGAGPDCPHAWRILQNMLPKFDSITLNDITPANQLCEHKSSSIFLYSKIQNGTYKYAHETSPREITFKFYKKFFAEQIRSGKLQYYPIYHKHFDYYVTPDKKQTFSVISREYLQSVIGLTVVL